MTRADAVAYAGQVVDPDRGDRREDLLDRREPLGAGDRVRRDRGPLGRAARGALHAHAGAPSPTTRRSRWPSSGACPSRSTATAMDLEPLIAAVGAAHRRARLRPPRHGREPPRRHQVP